MPFCSNCGSEVNDNAKFCPSCGNQINAGTESENIQKSINSGINCPRCGSIIPLGSTVCSKCGSPLNDESHTGAIIIGYVGTILGSLIFLPLGVIIGIITSIYLLTRNDKSAKTHGIIIIILSVVIIVITLILLFSYLSYVNSYYYY